MKKIISILGIFMTLFIIGLVQNASAEEATTETYQWESAKHKLCREVIAKFAQNDITEETNTIKLKRGDVFERKIAKDFTSFDRNICFEGNVYLTQLSIEEYAIVTETIVVRLGNDTTVFIRITNHFPYRNDPYESKIGEPFDIFLIERDDKELCGFDVEGKLTASKEEIETLNKKLIRLIGAIKSKEDENPEIIPGEYSDIDRLGKELTELLLLNPTTERK
ncbi:hypothetical protein J4403_00855 [Candidatus Woesearchaeota archaeon]|nr:hypothetical protein [Candidatus Woesearchaeota archaeon]